MEYKLYTLVDITHTDQYRANRNNEADRWREQNFNTVIQTIGIRGNIVYRQKPAVIEVAGTTIGFNTDNIIRVWRFDFSTERDQLFDLAGDPVGHLKQDFHLVPYINGLDELMEQQYAVFTSTGESPNIIFYKK